MINEEEVIIREVDQYPLEINDREYNNLLAKIETQSEFSEDEYQLLRHVIKNAKFWKERYKMIQKEIINLSKEASVIIG
jgi:hypothetical protein